MKLQRGTWRVVGRSDARGELLVRPTGEDADVPSDVGVGHTLTVSSREYGGDLQHVVDAVEPGNLLKAGLYPGQPGRFVDLDVVDPLRLVLVTGVDRSPDFAVDLWKRAVADEEWDGPVVASMPLDVAEATAEVQVVQSTQHQEDDLWWSFVGGDLGDDVYGSFVHSDGSPAEVVAVNPTNQPFFYVMKFGAVDTAAATELVDTLSGSTVDVEGTIRRAVERAGLDAEVSIQG